MKNILGSMIGFALCALLMTACGDEVPGFGGGGLGTICASDDAAAGEVYECPDGSKTFDFCINTGNGSCYYVVDGENINCGNCLDGNTVNECVQRLAEHCTE